MLTDMCTLPDSIISTSLLVTLVDDSPQDFFLIYILELSGYILSLIEIEIANALNLHVDAWIVSRISQLVDIAPYEIFAVALDANIRTAYLKE